MDLIDRNKLADFANNTKDKMIDANDIMRFPTVDPVKHGQWLPVKLLDDEADFGEVDGAQCSECGYEYESEYWARTYFHYCPNCGADMRGEEHV